MVRYPAIILALCAALLLTACTDDGDASPTPAPSETAAASPTPRPARTPVPTRPPGQTGVSGLFTEPRPAPVTTTRGIGRRPESTFPAWDGRSTLIYDIAAGTVTNLGPGSPARFSPDSTRATWLDLSGGEPGTVMVRDLGTAQDTEVGPGLTPNWYDNERIIYTLPGTNQTRLFNTFTGQSEPGPSANSPDAFGLALPGGGRLVRTQLRSVFFPSAVFAASMFTFTIVGADGVVRLEFEATEAKPAGPDELVVATEPLLTNDTITTNIFIVNVNSGAAEYIATARYGPPAMPLAASEDYVVWTEAYCGANQGETRLYDRRDGSLTEIDASFWVTVTPDGLIGEGEFGPSALIDPATMRYTVVIPGEGGRQGPALDVFWSPDFKYASQGQAGGHGGYCGG